jgi:hypothetical protein
MSFYKAASKPSAPITIAPAAESFFTAAPVKATNEAVLVPVKDPLVVVVVAFVEVVAVLDAATAAFEDVVVVVDVVLAAAGEDEAGRVLVVTPAGGMVKPWRVAHVAGSSP